MLPRKESIILWALGLFELQREGEKGQERRWKGKEEKGEDKRRELKTL